MIAYITPDDGCTVRYALLSTDIEDARQEARLLGMALFGRFTFIVRQQ